MKVLKSIWSFLVKMTFFKGWPVLLAFIVVQAWAFASGNGFPGWLATGLLWCAGTLAWIQFREEILDWWKKEF